MNYQAGSGHSAVADFCEHGNESSDSIYVSCGQIVDLLSDY
jgi:hypothetical protein